MRRKKTGAGLHPLLFLAGYGVTRVGAADMAELINICSARSIGYRQIEVVEGESGVLTSLRGQRRLLRLAEAQNIELHSAERVGLPCLLLAACCRTGIILGVACCLFLVLLSARVLWSVRIEAEEGIDRAALEEMLAECGVEVGAPINKIDLGTARNHILLGTQDIAWVTLNINGTVATLRAGAHAPEEPQVEGVASNLVAARGGEIVSFEDARGTIVAEIGDAVSEGQLLVSGVYGDEDRGFAYIHARGKVFARCRQSFSTYVPRAYKEKAYTGREKCEKSLIFFKKEIKFFRNSRNLYPVYDKIDTVEYLPAPGGGVLPFGVRTVRYREYALTVGEHSDSALDLLARERLGELLATELSGTELLSKRTRVELSREGAHIYCDVRCIMNIAERKKIEVELLP